MGASLDPAIFNMDNARPLTFNEAVSNQELSSEQCVKIDGFWSGRALFLSAADANSKLSNVSNRLAVRRVGIMEVRACLCQRRNGQNDTPWSGNSIGVKPHGWLRLW